ncbi:CCN family member 3 [Microcaecilia unicolor]|uniref:CCN family member 3 n=1 Tax=Microcaecilia unicolor TaxID=1415580 RepID=A0A6P7X0P9_9AMPH|nr:CCN family member 3 [Microcaecilia unicolor]
MNGVRMQRLSLTFTLLLLFNQAIAQHCPVQCSKCPEEVPDCAPGVPTVLDGCACCLVCARQGGESCSELYPCQENSGFYCDYSADPRAGEGICAALEGDTCVYDGVIYRDGETFQPSCKYHCSCTDGQIGCVPRCNMDLLLPGPNCPSPRKVPSPGECCEKWICDSKDQVSAGGFAMTGPAYRQEAPLGIDASDSSFNCIEQTTEWSACSETCGMGISTRVSNLNSQCEMLKQTRLCMVRPCLREDENHSPQKKGKRCLRIKKSLKSIHFELNNCTSVKKYKPRFCGVCTDGRCCTPHSTRTVQTEFQCPEGKTFKRSMMLIKTCVCHSNCPQENAFFPMVNPVLSRFKV